MNVDQLLTALWREHPDLAPNPTYPLLEAIETVQSDQLEQSEESRSPPVPRDVIHIFSGRKIMLDDIIKAVVTVSRHSRTELFSGRRFKELVYWRHIIFFLADRHTALSHSYIGRCLGGRDPSTVHHGVCKIRGDFRRYEGDIAAVEALL